jgi:SAM-dependent methyltransferase
VAAAARMQGWTFEYEPVPLGLPIPWDYAGRARQLAAAAGRLVDLGTGGGEVLERILAGFTGRAFATEAWGPNVPVAARRLRPLGVAIVQTFNLGLPFATDSFDLLLDRHEELWPADVARVLRPGGRVLTQQLGADTHAELREFFPRMTVFEPHDETYPSGFAAAGLELLDVRRHKRRVAYRQLGHLVYFLAIAPWYVPGFNLESDLEALLEAEKHLGGPEGITLSDPRYLVEARKPA